MGTPPCWSRGEALGAPIECAVGCREVFIVSGCWMATWFLPFIKVFPRGT